jgi:solute carrier family 25 phosphate transporter 23/24/25/41
MNTDGAKLSHPSILKEARRIFREEGMTAFWKGNALTIVHWLPYSSINFFAYEQYKMV